MKCPFCGGLDNKVTDSRLSQGDEVIRRRRECEGCTRRFTTYERIELVLPMVVRALNAPYGSELALDPFAHHGFRRGPHIEIGIEAARHAFDDHHCLLQEQQLRLRLHVELARHLEELIEKPRHGDFPCRAVHDWLGDGAQSLRKICGLVLARHIASLEMHLRHPPVVAPDEA